MVQKPGTTAKKIGAASSCDYRRQFSAEMPVHLDRLQAEDVFSFGNHRQWDGRTVFLRVHVPGFKPRTEPGIEDVRLAMPEIRFQPAFNLQMIQLQLDARNVLGKVTADIVRAHMQSGVAQSPALRFDNHTHLPIDTECDQSKYLRQTNLVRMRIIRPIDSFFVIYRIVDQIGKMATDIFLSKTLFIIQPCIRVRLQSCRKETGNAGF